MGRLIHKDPRIPLVGYHKCDLSHTTALLHSPRVCEVPWMDTSKESPSRPPHTWPDADALAALGAARGARRRYPGERQPPIGPPRQLRLTQSDVWPRPNGNNRVDGRRSPIPWRSARSHRNPSLPRRLSNRAGRPTEAAFSGLQGRSSPLVPTVALCKNSAGVGMAASASPKLSRNAEKADPVRFRRTNEG